MGKKNLNILHDMLIVLIKHRGKKIHKYFARHVNLIHFKLFTRQMLTSDYNLLFHEYQTFIKKKKSEMLKTYKKSFGRFS
jgi:hypothetical protein